MNTTYTHLGTVDETHDPLVYGRPYHRNPDEHRPIPAVQFLTELGMDETEAVSWFETLCQRTPLGLSEDDLTEHTRRRIESREAFCDRIGLNAVAAFDAFNPVRLAQKAEEFRAVGFTCAASILHLINAHATPDLAVEVHAAGASRGDVPYVIEAARAVIVRPPVTQWTTWLNIYAQDNVILSTWFTSGISARWVPRYLAAHISLPEALTYYEPQRRADEQKVLDALQMLVALRTGALAA